MDRHDPGIINMTLAYLKEYYIVIAFYCKHIILFAVSDSDWKSILEANLCLNRLLSSAWQHLPWLTLINQVDWAIYLELFNYINDTVLYKRLLLFSSQSL